MASLQRDGKRSDLLQAFPDGFGTGVTSCLRPESPQSGRSVAHQPEGGGVSGGWVRCATIQAACHSAGSNTTSQGRFGQSGPGDQMQDAPGDDQVNHQSALQPLQGPQLQRLDRQRISKSGKKFPPASGDDTNESVPRPPRGFPRPVGQHRHTIAFDPPAAVPPAPGSRSRSRRVGRDGPAASPRCDTASAAPTGPGDPVRPAG